MAPKDLPELARARQLWARDLREEAVSLFQSCAARHPKNPFALIDAARASGQWFDLQGMEKYLAKLLRLPNQRAANRLQAGQTYRMNYRPEQAVPLLERIDRSSQSAFLAKLELAMIYERQGEMDLAIQNGEAALSLQPDSPESKLILARAMHRMGQSEDAAALLDADSQQASSTHPDTRAASLALRAQIRERAGDYSGAVQSIEHSKQALQPIANRLPDSVMSKDADIAGFFDNLTQQHIDQLLGWSPPGGRKGVSLMTSFPRSGTTLLESMLGSHPEVAAADELPVFVNRLLPSIVRHCGDSPAEAPGRFKSFADAELTELRNTYLNCHSQVLQEDLSQQTLLDKNPSLTVFIPFFLRAFPELKVLVPLRDPRDVLLSCYFQYLPVNPWSVHFLSLESTAKRFVNVMGYWTRIRELLPKSSWMEVRYESLVSEPEQELRRTLDFLDLPWHAGTLDYHSNRQVTVHNAPTYADVRNAPHQKAIGRWEKYNQQILPLRDLLEPVMADLGYAW